MGRSGQSAYFAAELLIGIAPTMALPGDVFTVTGSPITAD
jgi:hypothetical protein